MTPWKTERKFEYFLLKRSSSLRTAQTTILKDSRAALRAAHRQVKLSTRMRTSSSTTPWLLGPKADALFIANAAWPLIAVLLWLNQRVMHTGLDLYLMYVIGTPHRWLTPGLVALDKERMAVHWPTLLLVGAGTVA